MSDNLEVAQDELITAAESYAESYEDDDRECIATDVINAFSDNAEDAAKDASNKFRDLQQSINATQSKTDDQVLRWHVEWMMTLPRMTGYFGGENVVEIPPLPN